MTATGPTSLPAQYVKQTPSLTLLGANHDQRHVDLQDELRALWSSLGLGASGATPTAGTVRRATGTGTATWGQILTADIAAGQITNPLISDSQITSAKIVDGTITTLDMAANAITGTSAAYGTTNGPTTTSTTPVDLSEMSISINTTAGSVLLVLFNGMFANNTLANQVATDLVLDGTQQKRRTGSAAAANALFSLSHVHVLTGLSAASHTVKIQWFVSGGTGTASGVERSLVVVELKK